MVVMLQRLDEEKAPDVGLRAWAASGLADRGWRLVVAGTGVLRPDLERPGRPSWAAPDRWTFAGQVADTDGLLAGASVLLAPAPAEPFGLSVVEAMSHGLAVVAAAGGAHVETVADAGLLFPPGDADAAAAGAAPAGRRPRPPPRRRAGPAGTASRSATRWTSTSTASRRCTARWWPTHRRRRASGQARADHPLVERRLEAGHARPRVAPDRRPGPSSRSRCPEPGLVEEPGQGGAQGRPGPPVAPAAPARRPRRAGHHCRWPPTGHPGGLSLDHDPAELLEPSGTGTDGTASTSKVGDDPGEGGLVHVTVERDPAGRRRARRPGPPARRASGPSP